MLMHAYIQPDIHVTPLLKILATGLVTAKFVACDRANFVLGNLGNRRSYGKKLQDSLTIVGASLSEPHTTAGVDFSYTVLRSVNAN